MRHNRLADKTLRRDIKMSRTVTTVTHVTVVTVAPILPSRRNTLTFNKISHTVTLWQKSGEKKNKQVYTPSLKNPHAYLQKAAYQTVKCHLLPRKTPPFTLRFTAYYDAHGALTNDC